MNIKICNEFSNAPGGRFKKEGPFSGEEFRDTILIGKYLECVEKKEKLYVDLDGGYGYGSSFLEEAFGGLVRKLKETNKKSLKNILDIVVIISNEEPAQIEKIQNYIKDALKA